MKLSTTELDYLRQSLTSSPPIRPDCRQASQLRPVTTETDLLPATNGSARVWTADGSECIVGIKVKVSEHVPESELIDVTVGMVGLKDNDPFAESLAVALRDVLQACPELKNRLRLGGGYSFRLFVDCIVLSYTSHPLSLVSLGVFQALKAARLPRPLDSEAEEGDIPQFNDDWSQSEPLCIPGWTPPLLLIFALVGDNTVIVDPTLGEEQVAEACMCVTYKNGNVAAPIRTLDVIGGVHAGPFAPELLLEVYDLAAECAPQVVSSLQT